MPVARATSVVNNYCRNLAKDYPPGCAPTGNKPLSVDIDMQDFGPEATSPKDGSAYAGARPSLVAHGDVGFGKTDSAFEGRASITGERRASIMEAFAPEPGAVQYIHSKVWFKTFIALCVVLNAVQLGMELDYEEYKYVYNYLDHIFTGFFTIEMLIKLKELKHRYFCEGWNLLDFFLVMLSILDVWALPLVFTLLFTGGSGQQDLRMFSVLRILRVLRVIRAVRLLRVFQELWKIVRGIMDSVRTIFWASLLLIFLLYICGIFCCAMIGKNETAGYLSYADPEDRPDYGDDFDAYQFFGTVPRAMFTLFETCIEPLNIRPVVERQPAMLVFFIGFIFLTTFGVLNVIIGVIVDHTMAQNDEDESATMIRQFQEKMDKLEVVRNMCFDDDSNGDLSLDEIKHALETKEVQETFEEVGMPLGLLPSEFFTLLDDHGDGKVTHQKMMMQLTRAAVHTDHQQLLDLKIANHTTQRTVVELATLVKELQTQIQGQLSYGFGTVLPAVVRSNGKMPDGLMEGMRLAGLVPDSTVQAHLPEALGTQAAPTGTAMIFNREAHQNVQFRQQFSETPSISEEKESTFANPGQHARPVPPGMVGSPTAPETNSPNMGEFTHPHQPQSPSDVNLLPNTPSNAPPILPPISEPGSEDWKMTPQNVPGWAGTPQNLPGPPASWLQGQPPGPPEPPPSLQTADNRPSSRPASAGSRAKDRYRVQDTEDKELSFFTPPRVPSQGANMPTSTSNQSQWHPPPSIDNTANIPMALQSCTSLAENQSREYQHPSENQSKPNEQEVPELTPQPGVPNSKGDPLRLS